MSHAKSAKSAKGAGGSAGGKNSRGGAERLEDGFAQKDKKETKGRLERGRKVNIENHENRSADMERREGSGCAVGARAPRLRGLWMSERRHPAAPGGGAVSARVPLPFKSLQESME